MRPAMSWPVVLLFGLFTPSLVAADIPECRPGTIELSLGVSTLRVPEEQLQKTGGIAGAAICLKTWNLVVFADWTQLPSGGQGDLTIQGQALASGVQYQITRLRLPWRITPFAEGGVALANTQVVSMPINEIYDNDAGNRVAWVAGAGVRIPFGREARAGLKLAYRHVGIPGAVQRQHLDQFSAQLLVFIRPN